MLAFVGKEENLKILELWKEAFDPFAIHFLLPQEI